MKPADLIDSEGKLRGRLPDGRKVEYTITDLGKPGATATAAIQGQPAVAVDVSSTIRKLQRGDTSQGFQTADSLFDWPVQKAIEPLFPERRGYKYGGSSFAGSRIYHPGAIGDVSVKPVNKLDWIWRSHDIHSFALGHFETGTVIHVHTKLGRERYVSTSAWIIHPQALKATLDEIERREPGSTKIVAGKVVQKIETEALAAALRARAELFHAAREAIKSVFSVVTKNVDAALQLAWQIIRNIVKALITLDGAFATAGLLAAQEPMVNEEVFGELLTPPSPSSDNSAGGKLAVRVSDMHECPDITATVAHVGGPVSTGSDNIYIAGMAAARLGDTVICTGPPDTLCLGSGSVFWNGRPAARVADQTAHGGAMVVGDSAVSIG